MYKIRLTPAQLDYRLQLWKWLIRQMGHVPPGSTYEFLIVDIEKRTQYHNVVLAHLHQFMAEHVDLANGFEAMLSDNSDRLICRALSHGEQKTISKSLYSEA